MATSGSIDFVVTRDDVITEALELCGVLGEGESPNSDQLSSSSRTLNMLVKTWQANGLNLFAVQRLYVFLEKNKHEYTLNNSGDHFTTSFVSTAINGAVSSGSSSITVDDASSILDSDNIGIKLDDGTMQWTTVNGAPSGNDITLSASLTDDVNDGATVYAYTSKANRPMKILEGYVHSDSSDTPVEQVSRRTYWELSDKTDDGQVNQFYYDSQVSSPVLYVWPETDNVSDYLILHVQRTLEDFDAASDDADFPQEWYLPLAYNLAAILVPKYGVHPTQAKMINTWAQYYYRMAWEFDMEFGASVTFEPDLRNRKIHG